MRSVSALTLAFTLILVSCDRKPNMAAESAALMQTSSDWAKAAATGDVDQIVSFWADDAVVFPPDQPAVIGKQAIRDFVQQSATIPGFSITWEPEQASVGSRGDTGYLVEHNRVTFTDSTGVTKTQFGKAVTVWRKDANGTWKCVIDIWNNSPTERVLPSDARES